MLSWVLVVVLYLCGMVATFTISRGASTYVKAEGVTSTWVLNLLPTLLAWPLIIIAGVILGVYLLVKGKQSV